MESAFAGTAAELELLLFNIAAPSPSGLLPFDSLAGNVGVVSAGWLDTAAAKSACRM